MNSNLSASCLLASSLLFSSNLAFSNTLHISKSSQTFVLMNDQGSPVHSGRVSTGKRGHETPSGTFHVIAKIKHAHSRKYNAPMPNYLGFLSSYGVHQGHLPSRPVGASHGCVRLGSSDSSFLFQNMSMGSTIVISK